MAATLVGYWKLDETSLLVASDSSGHNLNGALTNMSGNEWTPSGYLNHNGCLQFDGADDKVVVADNVLLYSNEFSVSFWVWFNNLSTDQAPIGKLQMNGYGWWFEYINYNNKIDFTTGINGGWAMIDASPVIVPNTWYHVVCVYAGVSQALIKLYFNNVKYTKPSASYALFSTNDPMTFGVGLVYWAQFLNGKMDEIRYFNGVLTDREVDYLYNHNEMPPILCWNYTAKYKNSNRLYTANGSGKYPNEIIVPSSVDISTGKLIDEGKLINPNQYKIRS